MQKTKKQILKLREKFSKMYDCFSIIETNDGFKDPYFNTNGCECCESLACDTYDVTHLKRSDIKNGNFDNVYESAICGGCLCSLINGDDSDLDY
jgi:hypothetical protein